MAPTSRFTGQVHRPPDSQEAYGAMITRAKAAPPQTRSTDLTVSLTAAIDCLTATKPLTVTHYRHPGPAPGAIVEAPGLGIANGDNTVTQWHF